MLFLLCSHTGKLFFIAKCDDPELGVMNKLRATAVRESKGRFSVLWSNEHTPEYKEHDK